jgi:hypothetical protein
MRIAQLVFLSHGGGPGPAAGKYCMTTEPEFPKFWRDKDTAILRAIRDLRNKG